MTSPSLRSRTFERLSELVPDAAGELARMNEAAWAGTDPALLELCRRRIGAMLGDEPPTEADDARARELGLDEQRLAALEHWERSQLFTPRERAHLAFTEQFVTSVASVSDEHVQALLEHASEREVHAFASALYVVDLTERLDRVGRATFARAEASR